MTFSLSKILHSLTALCLLLNLSACGGVETASWTEEVRLHDGHFIDVSRKVMARKADILQEGDFGPRVEYEFKYAPMGVEWKGPWGLSPISFEIFDGVPYVVLSIESHEYCANKDDKDYAAKFMRWRNGQWEEMTQADFPADKAMMNLYRHFIVGSRRSEHNPTKGRVTWEIKAREDGYYTEQRDAKVSDPRDTVKVWIESRSDYCKQFEQVKKVKKTGF